MGKYKKKGGEGVTERARSGTHESGLTAEERQRAIDLIAEYEVKNQHKPVCDKGKSRPVKKVDFHLEKAEGVEILEPEWLVPGYIPKYGITTIAGEGGVGKTSIWCSLVSSITTGKNAFLTGGTIPFESGPGTVTKYLFFHSYLLFFLLLHAITFLTRI